MNRAIDPRQQRFAYLAKQSFLENRKEYDAKLNLEIRRLQQLQNDNLNSLIEILKDCLEHEDIKMAANVLKNSRLAKS